MDLLLKRDQLLVKIGRETMMGGGELSVVMMVLQEVSYLVHSHTI